MSNEISRRVQGQVASVTYLTPTVAQSALLQFDAGIRVKPFAITHRTPVIVRRMGWIGQRSPSSFGQPSSVYVDKNDNIYIGATYESAAPDETALRPTAGPNDRAIVIGNAITGELKYLIPDPGDLSKMTDTGTSASGIAVDDQGNIYAADVGFNNLRKYARVR